MRVSAIVLVALFAIFSLALASSTPDSTLGRRVRESILSTRPTTPRVERETTSSSPQVPPQETSCMDQSVHQGCLSSLILRAYESYNNDPKHLFTNLFQELVEPDVIAFSSSKGPNYIRGAEKVLRMLVQQRVLGQTLVAMNDIFQSDRKVVVHFTMRKEGHKTHHKKSTGSKMQGIVIFHFSPFARIQEVYYAMDTDTALFQAGLVPERNSVVKSTIEQKGFNDVVSGSNSKPTPYMFLTLPERIRRYFDAWNTLEKEDSEMLEQEFSRLISNDIVYRDLSLGGKVCRNFEMIKKLLLEDWRQEGNLVSIEDTIWMPHAHRVAVRMTHVGKVKRTSSNTSDSEKPLPLRIIAIFHFDPITGKVNEIVKAYDSTILLPREEREKRQKLMRKRPENIESEDESDDVDEMRRVKREL